ncbi:hypothetical protein [Herminiimonas sp. CN]|uniref:hypothetical protein n=1 Tax=Herminiimonas sp. CN TaxID=1349818 RepID=UPI0012DFC28F|nr:hypothetical protein [Herminiimonas sp. CN]
MAYPCKSLFFGGASANPSQAGRARPTSSYGNLQPNSYPVDEYQQLTAKNPVIPLIENVAAH